MYKLDTMIHSEARYLQCSQGQRSGEQKRDLISVWLLLWKR